MRHKQELLGNIAILLLLIAALAFSIHIFFAPNFRLYFGELTHGVLVECSTEPTQILVGDGGSVKTTSYNFIYRYQVNGIAYEGRTSTITPKSLHKLCAAGTSSKEVSVYYSSENPAESSLIAENPFSFMFFILLALVLGQSHFVIKAANKSLKADA